MQTIHINKIQYHWLIVNNSINELHVFEANLSQPFIKIPLHKDIELPIDPKLVEQVMIDIEFGCLGGNHHIVPMLGYENSIIGEECLECGTRFDNRGKITYDAFENYELKL